jgi:serine/threonine-protein kinase
MLRLAGTGGVGRVWLVRDASLGRDVALKELRPDRADPGYWGRFVREAQVTGQLEHPGIVPVYEVGRRPEDNQPFYTMRFVHGRTLKDAIAAYHERRKRNEAGPLELRELLGAFVQVCQAVGYAHSRGVLHRDLKPHNVALGDYGEVMVLDWGLAKVQAEAAPPRSEADAGASTVPAVVTPDIGQDPTQAGAVLGTPQYMAPEQAEGRLDLLDARSDVYGLGAILYHLLTGAPPFAGRDTAEVLDRVRHDPPRPPRELVSEAPPPLEAVCLKALAKRREDRYPSAQALAEEVLCWLADEPVTAYRDPLTVRLTRWGRRHRTAVTTGAALLLTTTVALVIGLVAVNGERAHTARAKQATEAALAQVTEEQGKTQKALQLSKEAERSASQQRQLALKTVRGVVDDIHALLKDRPGQEELRKELLRRALAGLKEVARAADTATAVDHETVWARFELGDIFLEIDGSRAQAKAQYEKAHELARQVWQANPESAVAQRDLSLAHQKLGDVCLGLRDRQAALDNYQKALEISQRLADADPTSALAQRDLSVSHGRLGDVYLELGEGKAALDSYQKGLEIDQRLADADKTSALAQRDLAISYERLGDVYLQLGDNKAALDNFKKASERLAVANPSSAQAQRDLVVSHHKLGDVQQRLEDGRAARGSYKKALALARRLAVADSLSAQAQRDLLVSYSKLGAVAQHAYDFTTALGWFGRALDVPKRFPKTDFFNQDIIALQTRARFCRAAEQAVVDPATVRALPEDLRGPVAREATVARLGRTLRLSNAVAGADQLADSAKAQGDLYNAACDYTLCVPPADKPEAKEKYAARAVDLLRQAVAKGFQDVASMKEDADLDVLRPRDDFQKLLADLEAVTKPKDR